MLGYFRSMAFSERAALKYSSLKLFLSFSPRTLIISEDDIYVSLIHEISVSTCWLNLWGTYGVLVGYLSLVVLSGQTH